MQRMNGKSFGRIDSFTPLGDSIDIVSEGSRQVKFMLESGKAKSCLELKSLLGSWSVMNTRDVIRRRHTNVTDVSHYVL